MPKISHKQKSRKHRSRRTKKYTQKQKGGAEAIPLTRGGIGRRAFRKSKTEEHNLSRAPNLSRALYINNNNNNLHLANPNEHIYTKMAAPTSIYENVGQFTDSSKKAEKIRLLEKEIDFLMGKLGVEKADLKRLGYNIVARLPGKEEHEKKYIRQNAQITSMETDLEQKFAELEKLKESNA